MNDLLSIIRQFNRAIIAIATGMAVLGMVSCSTQHSVADRQVCAIEKHDTVRLTQYRVSRDSVYLHDSVYLEVRGDTVRYTLYRDRWHYGIDTLHDTVYISKRADSTATTQHTESTVTEKARSPLSLLRDWLIGLGCVAVVVIALFIYRKTR